MALPQAALSELLDAFRAGDGVELIRDAVRLVLQELIEPEATREIGAARYERIEFRMAERDGARSRVLSTQAGDVQLRIRSCARVCSSHRSSSRGGVATKRCMPW